MKGMMANEASEGKHNTSKDIGPRTYLDMKWPETYTGKAKAMDNPMAVDTSLERLKHKAHRPPKHDVDDDGVTLLTVAGCFHLLSKV